MGEGTKGFTITSALSGFLPEFALGWAVTSYVCSNFWLDSTGKTNVFSAVMHFHDDPLCRLAAAIAVTRSGALGSVNSSSRSAV